MLPVRSVLVLMQAANIAAQELQLYVDGDSGDDLRSGSNWAEALRTLGHAQIRLQQMREQPGTPAGRGRVQLRGKFRQNESLFLQNGGRFR